MMTEKLLALDAPTLRLPHKQFQYSPVSPLSSDKSVDSFELTTVQAVQAVQEVPTCPAQSRFASSREPQPQHLPLNFGMGWNPGIVRQHAPNEDNLFALQGTCSQKGQLVPFGLFVVADGMGGHAFGQEASHLAIQAMMQTVLQDILQRDTTDDDTFVELLVRGVELANEHICLASEECGREMGTTVTAALIVEKRAYLVNVGDSRTYLYRDNLGLVQITRDHSLVARLVAAGAIAPEEVYTHPQRNKVYRCVGNKEGVEVDWFTVDLREGDSLLLCSDGLWEMVRDPAIERILRSSPDMHEISTRMVQAALYGGGADNISVIAVRLG